LPLASGGIELLQGNTFCGHLNLTENRTPPYPAFIKQPFKTSATPAENKTGPELAY